VLTTDPHRSSDERGFTLLELMVVAAVLVVVLALAGGALISVLQATNRTNARTDQQQNISTTLDDISRDLRSTDSLVIPSGADPSTTIELLVNNAAGGTTPVEWTYNASTKTLLRKDLSANTTGWTLIAVTNPGAIFTYYNDAGTPISIASNIVQCTTRVAVAFAVGSTVSAVPPYSEQVDVALTDRVQVLSLPGNNQC
jgi:prepilin-type N-terminal cleavage/methylation domain-containing protein